MDYARRRTASQIMRVGTQPIAKVKFIAPLKTQCELRQMAFYRNMYVFDAQTSSHD
jgi:hypothetical protein